MAVFDAYKDWVRRNRQWLSSAESMANTLTWLLPDRFAESELAPEALSTLIGVISVINDHIIETAPTAGPPQATGPRRLTSQPSAAPQQNQQQNQLLLQNHNNHLHLLQPSGFPPNQAPNLHAPNLNLPGPYPYNHALLSHNGAPDFIQYQQHHHHPHPHSHPAFIPPPVIGLPASFPHSPSPNPDFPPHAPHNFPPHPSLDFPSPHPFPATGFPPSPHPYPPPHTLPPGGQFQGEWGGEGGRGTREGDGGEQGEEERKGRREILPWALVLAVVKEVEVLGEMAADQWLGEDNKWTAVAGIEAVKAAIRLLLLQRDRWRLLIGGGSTANPGPSKPPPAPSASSSLQAQQLFPNQHPHSRGGPMGYGGNPYGNQQQAPTTRAMGAFQRFQRQVGGQQQQLLHSRHCHQQLQQQQRFYDQQQQQHQHQQQQHNQQQQQYWAQQNGAAGVTSAAAAAERAAEGEEFPDRVESGSNGSVTKGPGCATSAAHVEDGPATLAGLSYSFESTQQATEEKKPMDWIHCLHMSAELIHILRPLLYVLAIRAAARSARSTAGGTRTTAVMKPLPGQPGRRWWWWWVRWNPWLLSLSLDAASLLLHRLASRAAMAAAAAASASAAAGAVDGSGAAAVSGSAATSSAPAAATAAATSADISSTGAAKKVFELTNEERADLARRRMLLVMYLLRSPCFDSVTRHPLEGIRSFVRPIPLLGSLAERGFDMLLGIQSVYFYTAAS